jgi:hypothetical protein
VSIPFGPALIGQAEKTLNALLLRFLDGHGITEPHWATLRLAETLDGTVDIDGSAVAVADRARYSDATEIVAELADRGLLDEGQLTPIARQLTSAVQTRIAIEAGPIFDGHAPDDVAATTRVLNAVIERARVALGSSPPGGGQRVSRTFP